MNYPFRTALLNYLLDGPAEDFKEAMETIRENYPPAAFYSAMNFLGTHDTPRVLTVLGGVPLPEGRDAQAAFRLTPRQREAGLERLRVAAAILFTFPGSPMVYYGDETGMEGAADPFNRKTYPWGNEDQELLAWFRWLGQLRKGRGSLRRGSLAWLEAQGPLLAYLREIPGEATATLVNAGPEERTVSLPGGGFRDLRTGEPVPGEAAAVPPYSVRLLGRD